MLGPSSATLLRLWEEGEPLDALARAVALASVDGDVTDLPLGARDARLLGLVEAVAGPLLESVATCPRCGEQVSVIIGVRELLGLARADAGEETVGMQCSGYELTVRCLDSRDLADAAATGDVDDAERLLLERCVVHATGPAGAVTAAALPREVQEVVADAVAAADPLAEVLVDLRCPSCEEPFTAEVDVAAHAWAAVRRHARALLAEVDALARAYGWTESEVLALSEPRRRAYLRMARGEVW